MISCFVEKEPPPIIRSFQFAAERRFVMGPARGWAACEWFSPMLGGIMCSRPSLTVYMIARIDLGIMRHHATSCDIVRQLLSLIRAGWVALKLCRA